jgi:hypothetical protein
MTDVELDIARLREAAVRIQQAQALKAEAIGILECIAYRRNEVESAILLLQTAQIGHALPLIDWIAGLLVKAEGREVLMTDRDELARLIAGHDQSQAVMAQIARPLADRIIAAGYRRPSPAADEQEEVEAMQRAYYERDGFDTSRSGMLAALRALNRGPQR